MGILRCVGLFDRRVLLRDVGVGSEIVLLTLDAWHNRLMKTFLPHDPRLSMLMASSPLFSMPVNAVLVN
jgi:hypothetical protein